MAVHEDLVFLTEVGLEFLHEEIGMVDVEQDDLDLDGREEGELVLYHDGSKELV